MLPNSYCSHLCHFLIKSIKSETTLNFFFKNAKELDYINIPVAKKVEHWAGKTKVIGLISRESMI